MSRVANQSLANFCRKNVHPICVQGPTLKVENHTFAIFDKVKVTISLDDSNIQHQKIRMALIEPVVRNGFHQDNSAYVHRSS